MLLGESLVSLLDVPCAGVLRHRQDLVVVLPEGHLQPLFCFMQQLYSKQSGLGSIMLEAADKT